MKYFVIQFRAPLQSRVGEESQWFFDISLLYLLRFEVGACRID
jgi:hypothetical protein